MRGILDRVGWRTLLPIAKRLVRLMASVDARRRCDVIDPEQEPHWLYRDIGIRDGRPTRQEMRRPQKWPEGR